MTTALGLAALAALILANGWFVAAEFSYVAVRRGRLEDRAREGHRQADRALRIVQRLSFMLSGAQLGITATSLLVGFIARPTLGRALEPLALATGLPVEAARGAALTLALIMATAVQMVFGELAPKNLAIARAESVSLSLAPGVALYLRLAAPIIRLFDGSANRLLQAVGIEPIEEIVGDVSPEELGIIIEESGREGALSPAQADLLGRVLEFRDLRASDAMAPRTRLVTLDANATCAELQRLAVSTGHSRFPVCGEGLDDVVGVVQAKDVLRVPHARRAETPVRSLVKPPLLVPESAPLRRLLAEIRAGHSPLAVVVDEHGGTAGIVTLEDIVEELVGSIEDEHDRVEVAVQSLPDGTLAVPGSWRLDEVERETGVSLPTGDWETVSGLLMAVLGRVPSVGDEAEVGGARLRVDAMRGHAVARVRIRPPPPGDAEGRG